MDANLKIRLLIILLIIFSIIIFHIIISKYNVNRLITYNELSSFMKYVLEQKNNDKEFHNYLIKQYNYNFTYNQLKNALIKIKQDTIVNIHRNFLSSSECNYIINYCKDKLSDSRVYNNDNIVLDTKNRISKSYATIRNEDEIITDVKNRIMNLFKINENRIEELQIVKYDNGNFFKLHHDYINYFENKRKYSIIIYLNSLNEEDGGETYFPFYNQTVIPEEGTLIYFDNLFDDNSDNFLTLHEGKPILTYNEKYIITTWSRIHEIK